VETSEGRIAARWIAGADGSQSSVRRWAGLKAPEPATVRYGFRRHYAIAPWTDMMELHWSEGCQMYITPVDVAEICVAVLSRNPHLRLEEALQHFPAVRQKLENSAPASVERGAITVSRRLRRVCRGNIALVGDASGSVDAITGEGVCLALQHAAILANALAAGDLSLYQQAHRRISLRPRMMAAALLLLDRQTALRRRVLRSLEANPRLFQRLLAMHVGEVSPAHCAANGLMLGWSILTA